MGVASSTGAGKVGIESGESGFGARTKSRCWPGRGSRSSTHSSLLRVLVTKSSDPETTEELVPLICVGGGAPLWEQARDAAARRARSLVFTGRGPRRYDRRC